jgi:protein-L-isoaspartate(D-aspartate) O-methyltransferase
MVNLMNQHNARINMITQQLRTGDVLNETILSLFESIPRHEFVPSQYAPFAYSDMQIPLEHQQRMLTPLEEGAILQALHLQKHETVLEVGTGSGYFTALLSQLCHKVISVDYFAEFTKHAAQKLKQHHCTNVELITADAHQGFLEQAPYDVIVFTGAIKQLNETYRLQIVPGGRLFAIVGSSSAMQGRLYQYGHQEDWHETVLFETNTPLLINNTQTKEFVF